MQVVKQDFPPFCAYYTPVNARFIPVLCLAAAALLPGCRGGSPFDKDLASKPAASPHVEAASANALFLGQKTFDPWILTSANPGQPLAAYLSDGRTSVLVSAQGKVVSGFGAGKYKNGQLVPLPAGDLPVPSPAPDAPGTHPADGQRLDMRTGTLWTQAPGSAPTQIGFARDWPRLWEVSDIVIDGDPEAQQATHANLFYLLSSTFPGSDHSIPPMGLSSDLYGGHIFWDAEIWMLPALIVQHPAEAKSIIDYRFQRLAQARRNAAAHGFSGAEYPWESADTGKEEASGEFAQERHITADVGWAAWEYYLWTGDRAYLKTEGWPILQATAQYWTSRAARGADGKYHLQKVLSPDETAGVVDDDAWTNGVVQANLRAAARAAPLVGQAADPRWSVIAGAMFFPEDAARGIPAENSKPLSDRFSAKQADTLLLLHPLHVPINPVTAGKMLDFYAAHTSKFGPAMTASMEAVVASKLNRPQVALDRFRESYRPFLRGPWAAFSEKRTANRVYFCTGMGGCLQSVLYGFAGLRAVPAGERAAGTKIAGDSDASLYADPHLPPGWRGLTLKGVQFHGKSFDIAVKPSNTLMVTPK